MPASYTSEQPSNPRRHPTCWASSHWSHTVSSTPCHGTWTSAPLSAHLPIECKRTAPKIETPICTRRTTSHKLIWQQQHKCGAMGGLPMECGLDGQPHKTPHFHPWHRHPSPKWPSQEEPGSGLTASAPVSDVSAFACTNGVWSPLRPVSVALKNKPSTMLSSNVQSIDLPMDCMAWRFWTTRQWNGCSTSAPRSSAAKQWSQQLAQKRKKKNRVLQSSWHSSNCFANISRRYVLQAGSSLSVIWNASFDTSWPQWLTITQGRLCDLALSIEMDDTEKADIDEIINKFASIKAR